MRYFVYLDPVKKLIALPFLASIFAIVFLDTASAQQPRSFLEIGQGLTPQISQISNLVGVISFISGVVLGFKGLTKFKAVGAGPSQVGSSIGSTIGFVYLLTASFLIALPATMMAGVSTFGFTQYTDIEGIVQNKSYVSAQTSAPTQPSFSNASQDSGFDDMSGFGDTDPSASGPDPMAPVLPDDPGTAPD